MKIGLLSSWMSHRAGGLFDVVYRLAPSLQAAPDTHVAVFGLADRRMRTVQTGWNGVAAAALPTRGPDAWGYAPQLPAVLAGAELDLLHVHGLWMYYSAASRSWARKTGRPYMVSPHGMLDPWAMRNSGWKKQLALWAYEQRHLQGAACLHALCMAEADAIRSLGLRNPICIVPNGLGRPEPAPLREPAWHQRIPRGSRILLYLGRLHPKKGLIALLQGWQQFEGRADLGHGDWHLVIAGWDQLDHESELRRLADTLGITASVHFPGALFGDEKHSSFRMATAFVLPSVSEGLPMVVLEAWSHGLPVLMTRQCNLPEGFAAGAALEIQPDLDGVRRGLELLSQMSDAERQVMGSRGIRLCREHFSLDHCSESMRSVYRWLLQRGARPDCVLDDWKHSMVTGRTSGRSRMATPPRRSAMR